MALSQRPAPRFFAAFYRWTLHTHRPRPHAIACRYQRDGARMPTNSHMRRYHATRPLRRRDPLEEETMREVLKHHSLRHGHVGEVDEERELEGDALAREILGEELANESVEKGGEREIVEEDVEKDLAEEVQEERFLDEGQKDDKGDPVGQAQGTIPFQPKVTTTQSHIERQDALVDPNGPEHQEVPLKDTVRALLRKVPNSVAVITVRNLDPDLKKYVPMGVAVSSLTSVTLDPPTISFNIKEPSKTLDAIRAAKGHFRVHFPAADRGGAEIVENFCQGNHPHAYNQRYENLQIRVPSSKRDPVAAKSLAPQIRNESVHAAMECSMTHELRVADHVILAARVDSLEMKPLKDPLMIYVDGKYMQAQTTVSTHGEKKTSVLEDAFSKLGFFPSSEKKKKKKKRD